jgi:uncharacterized membrane protein
MQKLLIALTIFFSLLCAPSHAFAQTSSLPLEPNAPQETFVKAKVIAINHEGNLAIDGYTTLTQTVKVQILEGKEIGKILTITYGGDVKVAAQQKVYVGQTVILDVIPNQTGPAIYTISDFYRLDSLIYLAIAFFLLTLGFTGKKGFGALVGLGVSLAIIMLFIIPQILHHQNPLLISIIGSFAILIITTYLAHGFSKSTSTAVLATFLSLTCALLFAIGAVYFAHILGLGTEDSYLLELTPSQSIDPRGLFLGGVIIGTLGALNDITTTQVAAIFALKKHNPKLTLWALAEQGFLIGREHILSLVNTLVLAYAGTSLPIFIFFAINPSHLPWWVIINNESVAQEIVRTIAGSFGLMLAVPITTFLASWFVARKDVNHV